MKVDCTEGGQTTMENYCARDPGYTGCKEILIEGATCHACACKGDWCNGANISTTTKCYSCSGSGNCKSGLCEGEVCLTTECSKGGQSAIGKGCGRDPGWTGCKEMTYEGIPCHSCVCKGAWCNGANISTSVSTTPIPSKVETNKCYSCGPEFGNCKSGSCGGDVCVKTECSAGGQSVTRKGCDRDPGWTGCKEVTVQGVPCHSCVCKGDMCNGAIRLMKTATTPIAIIIGMIVFEYFFIQ